MKKFENLTEKEIYVLSGEQLEKYYQLKMADGNKKTAMTFYKKAYTVTEEIQSELENEQQ